MRPVLTNGPQLDYSTISQYRSLAQRIQTNRANNTHSSDINTAASQTEELKHICELKHNNDYVPWWTNGLY